ncbi:MAG: biopolymer transporter ExbD [Treponema sp.]|jgi:biopolymer transport protein ExbD|nr:biopolymer transporter ExbD [Treponema sp.]
MKLNRKRKKLIVPTNSMSDIAFLLLIFIMLVALINYRKEVPIQYALAETAQRVSVDNNLEIWVDREGNLYLDGTYCDIHTIEAGIIEAYTNAPDTRVHIIADKDTSFMHVQGVLEILQLLQYRVVSFVVKAL